LQTYIRHSIHHPENLYNEKHTEEELKKSTNSDDKVYINKTTWAKTLGINRRTLSRYIYQLIKSNHFIEILYDNEIYDKAKGKRFCCLQIVQDPFKYQKLLETEIRKLVKNFNLKIRKL
jgi:predicted regulator of amino acid metabolism with ACT domain